MTGWPPGTTGPGTTPIRSAALRWHPRWGDRAQELTVLSCQADPEEIETELRRALLTDAEVAAGESVWRSYPDPFGWWHTDPCGAPEPAALPSGAVEITLDPIPDPAPGHPPDPRRPGGSSRPDPNRGRPLREESE
jgi:hypothetical protein